jgi:hypothetical protein
MDVTTIERCPARLRHSVRASMQNLPAEDPYESRIRFLWSDDTQEELHFHSLTPIPWSDLLPVAILNRVICRARCSLAIPLGQQLKKPYELLNIAIA